jgi:hypothetical protein
MYSVAGTLRMFAAWAWYMVRLASSTTCGVISALFPRQLQEAMLKSRVLTEDGTTPARLWGIGQLRPCWHKWPGNNYIHRGYRLFPSATDREALPLEHIRSNPDE